MHELPPHRPRPTRPRRRTTTRALRVASSALTALLVVAGLAWAWSAATTNPGNSITAGQLATPGSPTATRTGGTGNTCTAVNVTWAAVPDATSYRIERNVNGTWTELAASHVTTSYGDSGSWTNYQLDYRITARLGNWESTTPAIASLACGIGDVDDLQATFASNCISTQLAWTAPLGTITSYNVQYRLNGGTWTAATGGTGITATTFTDTTTYTAAPHGTVEYRVMARQNTTVGNASNVVTATTDYGCLVPPTNVAVAGCLINNKTVTWTAAPAPVDGYTVRRRVNGGAWASATTNVGTTTWTDTASHTAGQLVEYGLFSENGTLVDTVLSGTDSLYSGFYVRSIAFANSGTLGTLNAGDTVTVTFSQPVAAGDVLGNQITGSASGGTTRGVWLAAGSASAAAAEIGRVNVASVFSNGTVTGTAGFNPDRTVWTWTATGGGMTQSATLSGTFTAGTSGTRAQCGTSSLLTTPAPTLSGRW